MMLFTIIIEFAETARKQMLVVSTGSGLLHVHHQQLGKHDISVLPIIIKEIGSLAYDSLNNSLFLSNTASRTIISYNLNTGASSVVPVGEIGKITAMDFGAYMTAFTQLFVFPLSFKIS